MASVYDKELVLDILKQIIEAIEIVQERCAFANSKMILWTQKKGKKSSIAFV